ncbi:unnamed protein product [Peniophora sp. CBMAI 1063]|nr:unnamed protein product [Peniophora sp. CBMAI 1063]
MDHPAILEQIRTNVSLLRKEGIMNSDEAASILNTIASIFSRLRDGTAAPAKSIGTTDAVNVLTTHFPFKARAVAEHEKARDRDSDPPELIFVRTNEIVVTGEYDSKYWLGRTRDGRTGKVPKEKIEPLENVKTVLSYTQQTVETGESPPAYTVVDDPAPETSALADVPTIHAAAEPPSVPIALAPAPIPSNPSMAPHAPLPPVSGPSTDSSYGSRLEATNSVYDRNPALNRNTTLPPRPNRNSRPDMDLRRVNTAQTRHPLPQALPSPSAQQFNQRYSQVIEPSSPSFASAPHREEHFQPPQPYDQRPFGQRPSSYYSPAPNTIDYQYGQSRVPPPPPIPGSPSYSQPPYPQSSYSSRGAASSMPMPSVPGDYTSPGPSGYYNT